MSATNGVFKIERKGKRRLAIGDKEFEVDVIDAFNSWIAIDAEFRDPKHPGSATPEYVKLIARLGGPEDCSHAEAIEFINIIEELGEELKKKVSRMPSSPESSAA